MANKKPGPKGRYINYAGETVEGNESLGVGGISRDKSTKQHYFYYTDPQTGNRKKKILSVDPTKAIRQYQNFKETLTGKKSITILKPADFKSLKSRLRIKPSEEMNSFFEDFDFNNTDVANFYTQLFSEIRLEEASFIEDLVWEKARELIYRDPVLAAKKIGIEQLAYLDDLQPKEKPISLTDIGDLYFKRQEGFSGYEEKFSRRCWKEFLKITKSPSIIGMDPQNVDDYEKHLWSRYNQGIWSAKTLENRFVKIRAILNYALQSRKTSAYQKKHIRFALDLCNFKCPAADEIDPNPINPDDFRKILKVAHDLKDTRAVLCILLAANGAYLPKELGDIEKRHLDLKARTIIMYRQKTSKRAKGNGKVPRACYLWDRTIEAIKNYQAQHNHSSPYLIINADGGKLSRSAVGNLWYRLRKVAENDLQDPIIQFKNIRSGCRQAAAELELDRDQKIKYLMGQRSVPAIDDHYLKRRITLMKTFCLDLEKYFFPNEE